MDSGNGTIERKLTEVLSPAVLHLAPEWKGANYHLLLLSMFRRVTGTVILSEELNIATRDLTLFAGNTLNARFV